MRAGPPEFSWGFTSGIFCTQTIYVNICDCSFRNTPSPNPSSVLRPGVRPGEPRAWPISAPSPLCGPHPTEMEQETLSLRNAGDPHS